MLINKPSKDIEEAFKKLRELQKERNIHCLQLLKKLFKQKKGV